MGVTLKIVLNFTIQQSQRAMICGNYVGLLLLGSHNMLNPKSKITKHSCCVFITLCFNMVV